MQPVPRAAGRPRGGFTLVEILLALAILALVGSLFVAGSTTFFRARQPTIEDRFWQAVAAAREAAVESGRPVVLTFDSENRALVTAGGARAAVPLGEGKVDFLSAVDRRAVLLGGQLVDTAVLRQVRFYPEGTCDDFRARLTAEDGRLVTLQVDPWTCAPVLPGQP